MTNSTSEAVAKHGPYTTSPDPTPWATGGMFAQGCATDVYLNMIPTGTACWADGVPTRGTKFLNGARTIFMKRKTGTGTYVGDACHGGIATCPGLEFCEIPRQKFGKTSVCSCTFDESKWRAAADPCSRAIVNFRNTGVVPRGMPRELFGASDNIFDQAFNYFMWQAMMDFYDRRRGVHMNGVWSAPAAAGQDHQWNGLDYLISDDPTLYTCPEARSMVDTFGGVCIKDDPCAFVEMLESMITCQQEISDEYRLNASWVLVGRREVLKDLAAAITCCKTTKCALGGTVNFSGDALNSDRLAMINGNYIEIEGTRIPFQVDRCTTKTPAAAPGKSLTGLYLVPTSYGRGDDPLYGEYFEYDAPSTSNTFNTEGSGYATLANGMYKVSWERHGSCLNVCVSAEERLTLEVPFLAGKITDIGIDTGKCAVGN